MPRRLAFIKLALIISILITPQLVFCDQFDFAWDYPGDSDIDGFRLYSGPMGQLADQSWAPKFAETALIDHIDKNAREITAVETGWPNVSKKFCFTVRAYRGDKESPDAETEDGEYLCRIIDNTPLQIPISLAGSFDPDQNVILISWEQADAARAKFWMIYFRAPPETQFKELGKVENLGQSEFSLDTSFTAVPEGQTADIDFVVVAFKDFDVHSPNSDELTITVDRRGEIPLPPAQNFKIKVTVPIK